MAKDLKVLVAGVGGMGASHALGYTKTPGFEVVGVVVARNTERAKKLAADLRLDMTGWLWTLSGSYAVVQQDGLSVNILAGARMLDLEEDLRWNLNGDISSLPVVDRSGSASAKDTQWDAIVGVKGRMTFGADRQWYVPYYPDGGAGESDVGPVAAPSTGLPAAFSTRPLIISPEPSVKTL